MAIKIKRAKTGKFGAGVTDDSSTKTLVDRQMGYQSADKTLIYNDDGTLVEFISREAVEEEIDTRVQTKLSGVVTATVSGSTLYLTIK